MKQKTVYPTCNDSRTCFAKGLTGTCSILTEVYEDGKCPFCKDKKEVTNGVVYPFNPYYPEPFKALKK